MPIEVAANNPLGLTSFGPGYEGANVQYPGQTGVDVSSYGYGFAAFPDQQTGIQAGISKIQQWITSGKTTTVSSLVDRFSPNDLSAFEQTTGLGPNDTLDPSQAALYAAGISAGEGTLSAFGGVTAFTGNGQGSAMNGDASPNPGTPDTGATSIGATIGALLGANAGTNQGQSVGNAAGGSESANPSSTPQQGFLGTILTDVEDFFVRGGLIIIGAVVIVVALWQLLSQHTDVPGPVEVVKDAGTALAAA